MNENTHVDLFSGIGGFSIAAERCGFKTVAFSEINPYAAAMLRRNWPGVVNVGSVITADWKPFEGAALLTGGFPCQPFSFAGKRRGASDDRFLWPAMLRAIEEIGPAWVLGENVAGIIQMELDRVLSDLESIGYAAWPVVIPACAVDARHRRDRVWIVANASGRRFGEAREGKVQLPRGAEAERAGEALSNADGELRGIKQECKRECGDPADLGDDGEKEPVANTDSERGRMWKVWSKNASDAWKSPGRESGWCQWEPEPDVGRVASRVPNRVDRLRALGNAIVPQVAEEILRAIAAIENGLNP